MLGIVVALRWELKSLTRRTLAPGTCTRIRDNTLVALSGFGAARAHAAAELLLSKGATGLLSWGFAAGLDQGINAGNVLLPKRVIGAAGESYPVSMEWHRRLHQALLAEFAVVTEPILESAMIVNRPEVKCELARRTHAIGTDMESAAQARLAAARGVPFVAVRVISDTANTRIPQSVTDALDPSGMVSIRRCVTRAVSRPSDGIAMVRLGIQFHAARSSLTRASVLALEASSAYLNSRL